MVDYFNNFYSKLHVIITSLNLWKTVLVKVVKGRFVWGNSSSNDIAILVNL